jgi:hypothetical protein
MLAKMVGEPSMYFLFIDHVYFLIGISNLGFNFLVLLAY